MRLVLDGKSLLIGTFAGAALVAGLGSMQPDPRSGESGTPPGPPRTGRGISGMPGMMGPGVPADGGPTNVPPAGRFQIVAVSDPGRGTAAYVLDTATGRVWREYEAQGFNGPKLGAASAPAEPPGRTP